MIPILFEYNATSFTTHGIGDLIDAVECLVKQTEEGEFELSFKYPVNGELMNELTIGRLVYVKANPWQSNQIFRIYGYEKALNQMVVVNCQHISYDLANIPCKAFKSAASASANTALANVKSNAVGVTGLNVNSFSFSSDVSGTAQMDKGYFYIDTPTTVRGAILDGDNSVKGCFGGDLVFDNYTVKLLATGNQSSDPLAGKDRGVVIEYGVDLMDLRQEENISEMFTGVLPYFTYTDNTDDHNQQIFYGDVQYASGSFRTHRIQPLDLTRYFPNQEEHTHPNASTLNSKALEWMNAEDGFGKPEISLTVSYASLGQDVRLHDKVVVRFVKMGIEVPSKVSSYTYDVLKERVTEIEVGRTKQMAYLSFEDASRLRKGLLPPERIQNKSLTADKYEDGSIGGDSISTGGIGSRGLAGGSVTESKIGGEAVTTSKIKKLAVTAEVMADQCVETGKLKDGAVATIKIGNKQVALVKCDQEINNAIATVWEVEALTADYAEIKSLVTNNINTRGIMTSYCVVDGTTDTDNLYISGRVVRLTSITVDGTTYNVWVS